MSTIIHKLLRLFSSWYWKIFRPTTRGARMLIVNKNKILLVKMRDNYFYLPGGHARKNETQKDAAIREVLEETGLKTAPETVLGNYFNTLEGKKDNVSVYICETGNNNTQLKTNTEVLCAKWFNIKKLPNNLSPGSRRRIKEYLSGKTGFSSKW